LKRVRFTYDLQNVFAGWWIIVKKAIVISICRHTFTATTHNYVFEVIVKKSIIVCFYSTVDGIVVKKAIIG